jgi:predicted dehydrogenase
MTPYRVGVIGLGIMGQRMMDAMQQHGQFSIAATWDLDQAQTEKQSHKYADAQAMDSAESLINSDLDLVYIATPPLTHLAYVRSVAEAGKAVFCEKPLAVDVEEARQVVEFVQSEKIPNAINFPFATTPAVTEIEHRIQQGEHGQTNRIEMQFHFSEWPRTWQRDAATWLSGRAQGGFLREVVSHFAYLTHRIIGHCEIDSVQLVYPDDETKAESTIMATLYAGNIPITISGGVGGTAPDYNAWTLYGTERSFRLQDWGFLHISTAGRWYDVLPETSNTTPMSLQLDALAQTLEGNPSLPDLEAGLRVQELIESFLNS